MKHTMKKYIQPRVEKIILLPANRVLTQASVVKVNDFKTNSAVTLGGDNEPTVAREATPESAWE